MSEFLSSTCGLPKPANLESLAYRALRQCARTAQASEALANADDDDNSCKLQVDELASRYLAAHTRGQDLMNKQVPLIPKRPEPQLESLFQPVPLHPRVLATLLRPPPP